MVDRGGVPQGSIPGQLVFPSTPISQMFADAAWTVNGHEHHGIKRIMTVMMNLGMTMTMIMCDGDDRGDRSADSAVCRGQ